MKSRDDDAVRPECLAARSQVARILAGAGDMSFVAYELDPGHRYEVVAHGLDDLGRLMISCRADEVLLLESVRVRIDVVTKSPEFEANIISSSMHALGILEWTEFVGHYRIGTIRLDHLVLHQFARPLPFLFEELVEEARMLPEVATDILGAREVVGMLGDTHLATLVAASVRNELPGGEAMVTELRCCPDHRERIYVVDICEFGITVLQTTKDKLITAFIAFDQPAFSLENLATQVAHLAAIAATRQASGAHPT